MLPQILGKYLQQKGFPCKGIYLIRAEAGFQLHLVKFMDVFTEMVTNNHDSFLSL